MHRSFVDLCHQNAISILSPLAQAERRDDTVTDPYRMVLTNAAPSFATFQAVFSNPAGIPPGVLVHETFPELVIGGTEGAGLIEVIATRNSSVTVFPTVSTTKEVFPHKPGPQVPCRYPIDRVIESMIIKAEDVRSAIASRSITDIVVYSAVVKTSTVTHPVRREELAEIAGFDYYGYPDNNVGDLNKYYSSRGNTVSVSETVTQGGHFSVAGELTPSALRVRYYPIGAL